MRGEASPAIVAPAGGRYAGARRIPERRPILSPNRSVALVFAALILVGTLLLRLPAAHADGHSAPWLTALFTAVSAVCVTGLVVVDTGSYWSPFGQWVVLMLFQVGGFGLMTAATLLTMSAYPSMRLRARLLTQAENRALSLADVGSVARVVLVVTVAVEVALTAVLALRLRLAHGLDWSEALWSGFFHAVSAFNNAGFSLHADSLTRYAADPWVLLPVGVAIVVGGIGFPVLRELGDRSRGRRPWSLHTKLTLAGTGVLLVGGAAALLFLEWDNERTLGAMGIPVRVLNALFASISARTAGFNAVDIGALSEESWALHYLLMFIGGGSAGTAGGVKVATALLLLLMVVAVVRGHGDSEAFGRRIGAGAERQAVTMLVLGSVAVVAGTMVLLRVTDLPTDRVIFEVISAFGTVGLSTGITADLPPAGQLTLILLMYAGRVGLITLASSLVLRERRFGWRYPEEHPIVG